MSLLSGKPVDEGLDPNAASQSRNSYEQRHVSWSTQSLRNRDEFPETSPQSNEQDSKSETDDRQGTAQHDYKPNTVSATSGTFSGNMSGTAFMEFMTGGSSINSRALLDERAIPVKRVHSSAASQETVGSRGELMIRSPQGGGSHLWKTFGVNRPRDKEQGASDEHQRQPPQKNSNARDAPTEGNISRSPYSDGSDGLPSSQLASLGEQCRSTIQICVQSNLTHLSEQSRVWLATFDACARAIGIFPAGDTYTGIESRSEGVLSEVLAQLLNLLRITAEPGAWELPLSNRSASSPAMSFTSWSTDNSDHEEGKSEADDFPSGQYENRPQSDSPPPTPDSVPDYHTFYEQTQASIINHAIDNLMDRLIDLSETFASDHDSVSLFNARLGSDTAMLHARFRTVMHTVLQAGLRNKATLTPEQTLLMDANIIRRERARLVSVATATVPALVRSHATDRTRKDGFATGPYRCTEPDCTLRDGFATENDLQRHRRSVHDLLPTVGSLAGYICAACVPEFDKPPKFWPRRDNFKAHIKRKHPNNHEATLIETSERTLRPGNDRTSQVDAQSIGNDRHSATLLPYTCPVVDCASSIAMFASQMDWTAHLKRDHALPSHWQCIAYGVDEPFYDRADFENHVRSKHSDAIAKMHIPTMLELSQRCDLFDLPDTCPVCNLVRDGIDQAAYLGHLAFCMSHFSRLSLSSHILGYD